MNSCTHTHALSHKHGAQEKRGLIWTPGEEAKCSPSTKTSYEQVRLIFRSQTLCLLLCFFSDSSSWSASVCPCPYPHLRLCLSVYPVLVNLACWCILAQERKERPSLSLSTLTLLSIYVYTIFTHRRVRNTRLWMTCLWTCRPNSQKSSRSEIHVHVAK